MVIIINRILSWVQKGGEAVGVKKSIQKSVRLSSDVMAYIEQAPGEGFNQKFEKIILRAKREEPELKARLARYNELLNQRVTQLNTVSDLESDLRRVRTSIAELSRSAEALNAEVRELLDRLGDSQAV